MQTIAAGETEWLETAHKYVDGGVSDDQVSDVLWAAFHAGQDQHLVSGSPVTAVLTLLMLFAPSGVWVYGLLRVKFSKVFARL